MSDSGHKEPRLPYSAPPESLAKELREVANAARAFGEAIRVANELPPDFPRAPMREIAAALEALPQGTGEGAFEQLNYARNRLSELRRRHILTDPSGQTQGRPPTDAPTPLMRGEPIDQTLARLVADIGTALDAYRALASRDEDERADIAAAVSVDPQAQDARSAAQRAEEAKDALESAEREVRKIVDPASRTGDDLARQMQDAAGLASLGHAEMKMRRPVPRWLRRIGEELRDYPALMRKTTGAIEVGVDIARSARQVWSDFKKGVFEAVAGAVQSASREMKGLADKWEGERAPQKRAPANDAEPFTIGKARAMILRGEAPPAAWVPMIDELNFTGASGFSDARGLRGLTALTSLSLFGTEIASLHPLAGLTKLTSLSLWNLPITDVGPLAGLTALTSLNLSYTRIADVAPLAELTALASLDLSRTRIADIGPLARLTALASLDLAHTQIADVSPLAGLTALSSLSLSGTPIRDVGPLAGLTALTSLKLSDTQVTEVHPLAGLRRLSSLDLKHTKVMDVSALKGLAALSFIYVESEERRAALAATLRERGHIVQVPSWR